MTEDEIRAMFGRVPPAAASRLLGFKLRRADSAAGRVEIEFDGKPDFCNPIGTIQGGFIAAMLDDAMAVAALVKSRMTMVVPTLEMKVSFLAPAGPGPLVAEGRVLQFGNSTVFLDGRLTDAGGALLAVSSATARPIPAPWTKADPKV